jgi:hypothetical protein
MIQLHRKIPSLIALEGGVYHVLPLSTPRMKCGGQSLCDSSNFFLKSKFNPFHLSLHIFQMRTILDFMRFCSFQ